MILNFCIVCRWKIAPALDEINTIKTSGKKVFVYSTATNTFLTWENRHMANVNKIIYQKRYIFFFFLIFWSRGHSSINLFAFFRVEVEVRRIGGGFGAKQGRSIYVGAAAALAAYHTQKPVLMCLTLQDNMEVLGKRQPFKFVYTVRGLA